MTQILFNFAHGQANSWSVKVAAVLATLIFQTASFGQASGPDFTVIALPDTQYYAASYPQIFDAQTQWIVDNRAALNIQFVIGLGDIVNGGGDLTQWANADRSYKKLDAAGIPYFAAIGNHDYDKNDPPSRTASTTNFNRYFGPSRYTNSAYWPAPYWKGSYPSGSNENFYGTVIVNGSNFLVLALELYPRAGALTWAKSVIQANPDKEVLLVTHSYEYFDNFRVGRCDNYNAEYYNMGADNDGDETWSTLVSQYPNVSLVIGGHIVRGAGEASVGNQADLGLSGNLVNEILADYQNVTNGGNGYLRILKYRPSVDQIQVTTYSPTLKSYLTDASNQFTVPWHHLPATGTGSIAGQVRNGSTCAAIAGANVSYGNGSTTTDASGNFNMSSLAPGTYPITVSSNGYQSASGALRVGPSQSARQKFFLIPSTGKATGRVTSLSSGAALAGATVKYTGGSVLTNSTGYYTFPAVTVGSYTFTASLSGYLSRSKTIAVSGGATTTTNFQLSTSGRIAGKIVSGTGAAVSGVTVKISGGSIATSATLTTNSTGNYASAWIPIGSYTVSASKSGFITQSKTTTVATGATATVNFTMK